MDARQIALEALLKLIAADSVGDYTINFEIVEAYLREADVARVVEPVWFACDTEGAEFDVTFVTTREEAAEAVDCALADDPDLKFEDLVTPLYAAPQQVAINAELLEALKWALKRIERMAPHHAAEGDAALYEIAAARVAIARATGATQG